VETVTTTTTDWVDPTELYHCPSCLIPACPADCSPSAHFKLLTNKVTRKYANCACEQHGWKLAKLAQSELIEVSEILGECGRGVRKSAWIGKLYGQNLKCPVVVGGAFGGPATVVSDCDEDEKRYVLCEMPPHCCNCKKQPGISQCWSSHPMSKSFDTSLRLNDTLISLPKVNETAKIAKANSFCPISQNGVFLITDLLPYSDAQTACQSTNAAWLFMDLTSANLQDLADVMNSCLGGSSSPVWIRSYNGLGVEQDISGIPCGFVNVKLDVSPAVVSRYVIYDNGGDCSFGQLVACTVAAAFGTTSTGTFPMTQTTTVPTTVPSTSTIVTLSTITTIRFTVTTISTLPSTTTTTSTSQFITVSISVISPP
jgi:hypothetical protein